MNQTKIEYRNGDVYEGEVNENNDKHGWGKMTYLNGDVYEGEWKKDLYHGWGKITYDNGDVYEGGGNTVETWMG